MTDQELKCIIASGFCPQPPMSERFQVNITQSSQVFVQNLPMGDSVKVNAHTKFSPNDSLAPEINFWGTCFFDIDENVDRDC